MVEPALPFVPHMFEKVKFKQFCCCNTCALGSGENWKRWVLIGPDCFSGGFGHLEDNKSKTK